MDLKSLLSKAKDLREKDYNCAQTVFCTFSEILDLDESTLFKISEGFGGGMGSHQECCGAITGGIMVLSTLKSSGTYENITKKETYLLSDKLRNKFIDKYDLTTCAPLKEIPSEDGNSICDDYIYFAVEMVCEILEEENLFNK